MSWGVGKWWERCGGRGKGCWGVEGGVGSVECVGGGVESVGVGVGKCWERCGEVCWGMGKARGDVGKCFGVWREVWGSVGEVSPLSHPPHPGLEIDNEKNNE